VQGRVLLRASGCGRLHRRANVCGHVRGWAKMFVSVHGLAGERVWRVHWCAGVCGRVRTCVLADGYAVSYKCEGGWPGVLGCSGVCRLVGEHVLVNMCVCVCVCVYIYIYAYAGRRVLACAN
jgi:hypothetical protein